MHGCYTSAQKTIRTQRFFYFHYIVLFWYLFPTIFGQITSSYHPRTYLLEDKSYISLIYIFLYNGFFFIVTNIFNNYNEFKFSIYINRFRHRLFIPTHTKLRILILSIFSLGIMSKIYQNSIGKFRMLDGETGTTFEFQNLESSAFSPIIKNVFKS